MTSARIKRTGLYCISLLVAISAVCLTILAGVISSSDGKDAMLAMRTEDSQLYAMLERVSPSFIYETVLDPISAQVRGMLSQLLRFSCGAEPAVHLKLLALHSTQVRRVGKDEILATDKEVLGSIVRLADSGVVHPRKDHLSFVLPMDPFVVALPAARKAMNNVLLRVMQRKDRVISRRTKHDARADEQYGLASLNVEAQSNTSLAAGVPSWLEQQAPMDPQSVRQLCTTCVNHGEARDASPALLIAGSKAHWEDVSYRILQGALDASFGTRLEYNELATALQFRAAAPFSGLPGGLFPPVARMRQAVKDGAEQARSVVALAVRGALGPAIDATLAEVEAAGAVRSSRASKAASAGRASEEGGRTPEADQNQARGLGPNGHQAVSEPVEYPKATSTKYAGAVSSEHRSGPVVKSSWLSRSEARLLAAYGLRAHHIAYVIADQILRASLLLGASAAVHGTEYLDEVAADLKYYGCSQIDARCAAASATQPDGTDCGTGSGAGSSDGTAWAVALTSAAMALQERPAMAARHWVVAKDSSNVTLGDWSGHLRAGTSVVSSAVGSFDLQASDQCNVATHLPRLVTVHGKLIGDRSVAELYWVRLALQLASCEIHRFQSSQPEPASSANEGDWTSDRRHRAGAPADLDLGQPMEERENHLVRVAFVGWGATCLLLGTCMVLYPVLASKTASQASSESAWQDLGLSRLLLRRPVVRWYALYLSAQLGLSAGFIFAIPRLQHLCMALAGACYMLMWAEVDCSVVEGGERNVARPNSSAVRPGVGAGAGLVRRGAHDVSQLLFRKVCIGIACGVVLLLELVAGTATSTGDIYPWLMTASSVWYVPCASAGMLALVVFAVRRKDKGPSRNSVEAEVTSTGSDGSVIHDGSGGGARWVEILGVFAGIMGVVNLFWPRLIGGTGVFHVLSRMFDSLFYVPFIVPAVLAMDARCSHGILSYAPATWAVDWTKLMLMEAASVLAAAAVAGTFAAMDQ